jgi:hypothetical protein
MLGAIRGPVSPTVLPAGAPSDALVGQIRVRKDLLHYYLSRMPDLERVHRHGVDALCDIATVMHLEQWVDPVVHADTMRPLHELVGPEEELGFGPSYVEVLDVLHSLNHFLGSEHRSQAVSRAWFGRRLSHWDVLAAEMHSAAHVTGRLVSLRMVTRVLSVSNEAVRHGYVFRATRLRAAALVLGDLLDDDMMLAASEPWYAGHRAGGAAAA